MKSKFKKVIQSTCHSSVTRLPAVGINQVLLTFPGERLPVNSAPDEQWEEVGAFIQRQHQAAFTYEQSERRIIIICIPVQWLTSQRMCVFVCVCVCVCV